MATVQLHRLEFDNFKSYVGQISIGPFADFTCAVGPNGSGKSNILDGLAFVLSGNVSRNVADVRDLINKQIRKQLKEKSSCSVTMTLKVGGTKEVTFTRRVKGNNNAMELLVDGHIVTDKEFQLGLRKYRIGTRVSNFLVFQHEVEAVAHKKAKEITDLIEQVSGSGDLKSEYNAKKKSHDLMEQQLTAASLEKRGAAAEMQQLKVHKKEADRYEDLQQKLSLERRDLALSELFHIEAQIVGKLRQKDEQQTKVAAMEKSVATEDDMRKGKKEFAEQHKKYLGLVKENREATLKLRELRSTQDRIKASVEHHQKKAARQEEELKAATSNTDVRSKEVTRLQAQLDSQNALLKAAEEQWKRDDETSARSNSMSPEQLKQYKQLKANVDCETVTLRQQIDTLRRQRDALAVAIKQINSAVDSTEGSLRDAKNATERNQAAERSLNGKVEELQAQEKALASNIESSRVVLHQMNARAKDRDNELANLDQQLSELKFVKDDNRHSARVTEAMNALTSMYPGRVHGRIVDLCNIPAQKYRNAVTVAFGKFLEAVIVDTTETAMACVRYLKEQRVAQMSFIPLSNAQGTVVTDNLRALGGSCRPAIDLVQFDSLYEPALRFALGDTLVCDELKEARKIAGFDNRQNVGADGDNNSNNNNARRKVVTLDGTVLLKSGAVQGGLAATQARARKWDEKLYDQLKAAREQLLRGQGETTEADLARAQCEAKDLQSNLDFTRKRIITTQNEIKALGKKQAEIQHTIKAHADHLVKLQDRNKEQSKKVSELEKQMQALQQQVTALENNAFSALQKSTGITNLAEWEQREAIQSRHRAEKRQALLVTIKRLENTIESEKKRQQEKFGGPDQLRAGLEKTRKELNESKTSLDRQAAILARSVKQQEEIQKNVNAAKQSLDEIEAKNRKSSKTTDSEIRDLANAKKLVNMLTSMIEALRQQRSTVHQKAKMEQIDLPTCDDQSRQEEQHHGGRGNQNQQHHSSKRRTRGADDTSGGLEVDQPLHLMRHSEPFSSFSENTDTNNSNQNQNNNNNNRGGGRRAAAAAAGGGGAGSEKIICVDFSSLSEAVKKDLLKKDTFAGFKKRTEAEIERLVREIDSIALPNLKASTRLDQTNQKFENSNANVDELRKKVQKALDDFTAVKEQRFTRFMATFEKLQQHVDGVYKKLTENTRASGVQGSAYLTLEDTDEPYNAGTQYHATPPMKRFMTMDALSGGERTMAALALLFSIHCSSPTPFFVLDEVDAALDIGNVTNLAAYMRQRCQNCQFIVVSLKDTLYHTADSLIGVYKDVSRDSSAILSLDVSKCPV